MKPDYQTTIGLEIHAELKTATKMFCASANVGEDAPPNTHVCPVCMGHPGTLPYVNKKAVESVIMVGLALGSDIASYTEFDRKNYFYPDIPKGYQISQYAYPLVRNGSLNGVAITRVHLEEDTARSIHDSGEGSLVDYNRAGVPLMELVTEPVIHDAKTAGDFARELQLLLRTLGVSDAHMERGQMRVEANISVSRGSTLGTKVEVKNLNSFRSVESAIAFEVERQIAALEAGEPLVQETRGWDEVKQRTFSQRKKESSHDYRYFPDPDIPKINLDVSEVINISRIVENMPELPNKTREKYMDLGISRKQVEVLLSTKELRDYFDVAVKGAPSELALLAANYLTSDILGLLSQNPELTLAKESELHFRALISMLLQKNITSRIAKDLLIPVVFEGSNPTVLISERGLSQLDVKAIGEIVDSVISLNPEAVSLYRGGKLTTLQYLVGQGMKVSKGAADPEVLRSLFAERLA